MKELSDMIIDYINKNKEKHNISYIETIKSIKALISELETDFMILEVKERIKEEGEK